MVDPRLAAWHFLADVDFFGGDDSVGDWRLPVLPFRYWETLARPVSRRAAFGSDRFGALGDWCVMRSRIDLQPDTFLYRQAAEHAKVFLKVLSSGKSYEAFELTLAEVERQITGTDIEAHYKALVATEYPTSQFGPDMNNMPSSSTMKNSRIKEEVTEFLRSASTMEILKHGEGAEWEFVRGSRITWPIAVQRKFRW